MRIGLGLGTGFNRAIKYAPAVVYNTYATLALGEAAEPAGNYFLVSQVAGNGAYKYQRTSTGSVFKGVQLTGANASVISSQRLQASVLTLVTSGLVTHLWGTNAWEWDGRVVPNEVGAALPTLNLLPDPFNTKNESGGATPTIEINTTSTTDPLLGSNAQKLTITAQNQQLRVYTTGVTIPTDNYRLRMQVKGLSGGGAFRLGTTSGLSVTATSSWLQQETLLSAFSGTTAIGINSATGNTVAEVAIAASQLLDPLAGEVAPSIQEELDAQKSGHLKMPFAFKGSSPLNSKGAITLNSTGGHVIHINPSQPTMSSYTVGLWVDATMPAGTYGNAISFDHHTGSGGANNLMGQVGLYGATDSVAGRPGRLYLNPNLSVSVNTTNQHFDGQGKQHLTLTVSNGTVMAYINSVPLWLGNVSGWIAPKVARLLVGAYSSTSPRRKTANPLSGSVQGIYFYEKALSQSEVTQMDSYGRSRLRINTDTYGSRKMLNIGCGDSLTAFAQSYWWHLGESKNLTPMLHGHLEAEGGTRLSDFIAEPRYSRLCQRIDAGVSAGYDEVWLYFLAGANDAPYWGNPTSSTTYSYADWKTAFLSHIAGLKARSPKVKVAILTMIPLPTLGLSTEVYRNTWNTDLRNSYLAMGFDKLIDIGLGTEKVDAFGIVSNEAIPGGTLMGNWRASQGAITYTSTPLQSLVLSALNGNSFTATGNTGTFTSADVYRRIVGGTGSARITAVNSDGSTATLTTTGYTPVGWTDENSATLNRDTVTYTAFDVLTYTSGSWSVRNDASFYQSDGIHPQYAGGRMLCDVVIPPTQTILDGLNGLGL